MENKLLGLILIATGKYDKFVKPLLDSADKYLMAGQSLDIYFMTDKPYMEKHPERFNVVSLNVPHLPWPYPTLYRYKWITEYASVLTAHSLYYLDVDMLFVNEVGEEILPDETGLVAVRHPGFYHGGWGDHGTKSNSTAYLPPEKRKDYYAGGLQGGERLSYLRACLQLDDNIRADEMNVVSAKWDDESHWNWYLKHAAHKSLTPEYCMVEQVELRKKWGIDKLTPRIIALAKDHKQIRG